VNANQITAVTPAGTGQVNVVVTNTDAQTGTLSNGYTYQAAPTITKITPNTGPAAGGTSVTIDGTGFLTGVTVRFGSASGTDVVRVSSTRITVKTPPGPGGTNVDVTVTNTDGQTAVVIGGYTYQAGPSITAVSPSSGSTSGGTVVTITGGGFVNGATVTFGGTAGTGVVFVSATELRAVTPAKSAGAVSVVVRNPDGQQATKAAGFTYIQTEPAITSGQVPESGFGLIVFSGGSNAELVAAALADGCAQQVTLRFYATTSQGKFVVFIPVSTVAAVNAAWNALFPGGIPAGRPLLAACGM